MSADRLISGKLRAKAARRGDDPSPCARYWASDLVAGLETVFNRRGAFNIAAVNLSLGGAASTTECSASW